jgi:hypothetical protein
VRLVINPDTGEKEQRTVTLDPVRHAQYFLLCEQQQWLLFALTFPVFEE